MKYLIRRENILIITPLLCSIYIYFYKNDNPTWALTFQGVSESLESAIGFSFIWWFIFTIPYVLHILLRKNKRLNIIRWLHIFLSVAFIFIFYWLFFEKTAVIPGWHTTVTPFNYHILGYTIPVFTFMCVACFLTHAAFCVVGWVRK